MAETPERPFAADRPKQGRARCKRCKEPCASGELRLARLVTNNFSSSGGWTKAWHHPHCLWEAFARQRAATRKIEDPAQDIEGWEDLSQGDRDAIVAGAGLSPSAAATAGDDGGSGKGHGTPVSSKSPAAPAASSAQPKQRKRKAAADLSQASSSSQDDDKKKKKTGEQDQCFRELRRLCVALSAEPSYLAKTAIVKKLFTEGSDGNGFKGDLELWVRLLLPMAEKRVYNLQSKQLVKLFSRMFQTNEDDMLEDLEHGDVAETIRVFFEQSTALQPAKKSVLTLTEVDEFLDKLTTLTREEEQSQHLKQIAKRCTSNDLKMIIRLVKHDLRINAGPKHILEAVHPDAYAAFQASQDIRAVVRQAQGQGEAQATGALSIGINIMTPVLPMLAEACKSVEQAMKKCPNGMFAEIKYDGERVQLHKKGSEFVYYSRALKPVLPHKVNHFKEYIPKAFPRGEDLVLDSEVLLIDTKTSKPLPFGSLGVHKKSEFKDANVCLFVFDCLYYNGESLMAKPMEERRNILQKVMTEIPNRIMFSECEKVYNPEDLNSMMVKVFRLGLEGLVLKDFAGPYEPGKRHWLKVKKDYLFGGAMADTADLVVLGAWYGTGQKGGMMSIFLMGCYDPDSGRWCTVTKVHGGHDDATLKRLQTELKMIKISKEASKIPAWLKANKQMYPDFITQDPKESPVWEITGAEFTQNEVHTADGISVRFPRVTRIRDDKTWEQATSLPELRALFVKSKETSDFSLKGMADTPSSPSKTGSPRGSPSKRWLHSGDADGGEAAGPSKRKQGTLDSFLKSPGKKTNKSPASSPKKRRTGPEKPLPDVFRGVRLTLPSELSDEDQATLKRYFIGFGGALLGPGEHASATHVLHNGPNKTWRDLKKDTAVHVDVEWLWNSIRSLKALDPQGYAIN